MKNCDILKFHQLGIYEMDYFMNVLVVRSRPELIIPRILTVRKRLIRDLNSRDQRNSIVNQLSTIKIIEVMF